MAVESILLNQITWSWYHSFQKTIFYLMKSKYAIFSNIKVTKIERSAFFLGGGTPGIDNDNGTSLITCHGILEFMINRITYSLHIFFKIQQLKWQISQLDKNWDIAFCNENFRIWISILSSNMFNQISSQTIRMGSRNIPTYRKSHTCVSCLLGIAPKAKRLFEVCHFYTGWPRKNLHLRSLISKESDTKSN